MQAMPDRLDPAALRRLQLRMCPVLRPAGRYHAARQGQGSSDAGGDSPIQAEPAQVRHRWFAERRHLGTCLSQSELEHGVKVGIISGALLS